MAKTLGKANPFDNLEGAFDVPSIMDTDPTPIQAVQPLVEKSINSLVVQDNKPKLLSDETYIREKMMNLIETSTRVLHKLEDEIKIGSGDRTFEVFSELADSVNKQLATLTDMNAAVEKAKVERRKLKIKEQKGVGQGGTSPNGLVSMTATQIAEMIRSASDNSQLKRIDAEFKIENIDKDEPNE